MSDDAPEVVLTNKVKSKSFRLYTQRQVIEKVQNADGKIFRKGDTDEYHLVCDEYAIVVVPEDGNLVAITQMHHHVDYTGDSMYVPVEDYGE